MAKQTITMLTDDLDGGEADTTVTFGYDGVLYEIDLSDKNAKALDELMRRYTAAGQRRGRLSPTGATFSNGGRHTGGHMAQVKTNREQNLTIREWAARNGYDLADRGRIPQHIVNAYERGISNPAREVPVPAPEPEPVVVVAPAKKATRSRAKASA